ncbi:ABC transporter permease [Chloroflexi bacterium]|nr:ABC transporter permease [Chloroflexota bacterium]
MFDNSPKLMEAMLGPIPTSSISPEVWLGIELYGLLFPIMISVIAISSGASAIGAEEDSGTIELILASPISRERILFEKSLGILAQLAIVCGFLWVGIIVGSLIFPFDVSMNNVLSATIMGWIFGFTVSHVTLASQALKGRNGLALAIGSGFVGISYVFYVLSGLSDNWSSLKYASLFKYYGGPEVLVSGLNGMSLTVMLGLSAVCFSTALYVFKRRDIGV